MDLKDCSELCSALEVHLQDGPGQIMFRILKSIKDFSGKYTQICNTEKLKFALNFLVHESPRANADAHKKIE